MLKINIALYKRFLHASGADLVGMTHNKIMQNIKKIEVCCGSDCMTDGAHAVVSVLEEKYADSETSVEICGCIDRCEKAVNVIVDENRIFSYSKPHTIVYKMENEDGEPYQKFTDESLNLSSDFLGDL